MYIEKPYIIVYNTPSGQAELHLATKESYHQTLSELKLKFGENCILESRGPDVPSLGGMRILHG